MGSSTGYRGDTKMVDKSKKIIPRPKVLFEKRGQAPSPSKDYHQILVTDEHVIFTTWRISLRKGPTSINPVKIKLSHDDFYFDTQISFGIRNVFGEDTLAYVQGLVHQDWLVRMTEPILIKIFSYLDLSDIFRLTPVCRHFRTLCNSNLLWKSIYETPCVNVKDVIVVLGDEIGWKKMFFTNKIQIRKAASRLMKHTEERDEKEEIDNLVEKFRSQTISDELFGDTYYADNAIMAQ